MSKKRIYWFLVVVALVLIFWSSSLLQGYFEEAGSFLQNYGHDYPTLSIIIFISLSALSAMLMAFSSVWLIPIAIILWGSDLSIVLLLISWLVGATLSYLVGLFGGEPIVKKMVTVKKFYTYKEMISKELTDTFVFWVRLILPSEIPGYFLGILKYPFWKYLFITFLAEIPYAIYYVYAIDSVISKDVKMLTALTIVWVVAVFVLGFIYLKKIKNKITSS